MKKLIIASEELINPSELSRERLETIVSQILDVVNRPAIGSSMQMVKILQILEFYELRKRS